MALDTVRDSLGNAFTLTATREAPVPENKTFSFYPPIIPCIILVQRSPYYSQNYAGIYIRLRPNQHTSLEMSHTFLATDTHRPATEGFQEKRGCLPVAPGGLRGILGIGAGGPSLFLVAAGRGGISGA